MTFFEFVSVVQKHFKNCEIRNAAFTSNPSVEIKPEYYHRFTQVASVNSCKQKRFGTLNVLIAFSLDGVMFICEVSELESAS